MIKRDLLDIEVSQINRYLQCFDSNKTPWASLSPTGEAILIHNYPLPDGYHPDYLNMAIVVDQYPMESTKGIYLLADTTNRSLLNQLKDKFNVFRDKGFHGAPSISGYDWICIGYLNGWRYNVDQPCKGDNVLKILIRFKGILEEKS